MSASRTTPEHLIDTVIAADAIRRKALGGAPARFKPWTRFWIEPWFNLLGILFGAATLLLPPCLRRRFYLWLCPKLGGHAIEHNPDLAARTTQATALAKDLYARTGQWPAVLILTSHGETEGPLHWLRFEMLRQGLAIANAIIDEQPNKGWFTHPQCLLAIDPYALDTLPVPVAGFYAGWMHSIYLAWDRQPSTQSFLQRHLLLRRSTYETIAWRFLERLRKGIPILMVFSGGLPHNARLLYAAREFVQSLELARWPIPKREAEVRLMKILMTPVGAERPAEQGTLPAKALEALQVLLDDLGVLRGEQLEMLERFRHEFKLAVPQRARLLRVLLRRIVEKGQPLTLIAISHASKPPYVTIANPRGVLPQDKTDRSQLARELQRLFVEG